MMKAYAFASEMQNKKIFFLTCRGLRIDIATLVFRTLQGTSFARIIILLREILTNTDLPLPPYVFLRRGYGGI
jgi:hypothetical protein